MRWRSTGAGGGSADRGHVADGGHVADRRHVDAMQVGKQAAALWKSKAEDAMQQVRLRNPAGASPDAARSRYDLMWLSFIRLSEPLLMAQLVLGSCGS